MLAIATNIQQENDSQTNKPFNQRNGTKKYGKTGQFKPFHKQKLTTSQKIRTA
jgi:hypothetical protein